ncbi:MAG TPA: DUF3108 domain-containing protein [Magnetovibrio sp.]
MTQIQPRPLTVLWIFTALIMGAPQARASELHLRYEANWGGLHVADFGLSLINGGNTYENRFHLETRGMTRYFTNMSVQATSRGHVITPPPAAQDATQSVGNASGQHLAETYQADTYRTEYTNKKHFRWVDIAFGKNGDPAHASTGTSPIQGREDAWNPAEKGPEVLETVDAEHRVGTSDPITMIPQMMAMVRAHFSGGPATARIKGFDGRRRFDLNIAYLGPASRTVGNTLHETYRVRVTPDPVAGFKNRHRVLWNNSVYDFYLSRDGNFVPLQIVPVNHGPVLTLVTQCTTACVIEAEEVD